MRRSHALTVPLLLACLAAQALLFPGEAAALLKRIKPMAFRATNHAMDLARTPAAIGCRNGAATTGAAFSAPVRLPVGATIDGVSFYYTADAAAIQATLAYIDTSAPATGEHFVATQVVPGNANTPTLASVAFLPGADLIVREGYRYVLMFYLQQGAFVWEGRVSYTP